MWFSGYCGQRTNWNWAQVLASDMHITRPSDRRDKRSGRFVGASSFWFSLHLMVAKEENPSLLPSNGMCSFINIKMIYFKKFTTYIRVYLWISKRLNYNKGKIGSKLCWFWCFEVNALVPPACGQYFCPKAKHEWLGLIFLFPLLIYLLFLLYSCIAFLFFPCFAFSSFIAHFYI